MLVVNPASGANSVADFLAMAKANPGKIVFGSAGNGTPGHLTGEIFSTAARVKLQHVPYKGSAPAITDLLGNQIPSMFDPLQAVVPHVRRGQLRAPAINRPGPPPAPAGRPTLPRARGKCGGIPRLEGGV